MAPAAIEATLDSSVEYGELENQYYSRYLCKKYGITFIEPVLAIEEASFAKIGYHANLDDFTARTLTTIGRDYLAEVVPPGWPTSSCGPMAWTPSDFTSREPFVWRLSELELDEIDHALDHVKGM